jgi:hypothetical protein
VPNHINQPTPSPTLRWIFQRLEGIHRVQVTVQGQVHDLIEGLNDVQIKILRLFGNEVCRWLHSESWSRAPALDQVLQCL